MNRLRTAFILSGLVAALAGCGDPPPQLSGVVNDLGPQNGRVIVVEVLQSTGENGVWKCYPREDPVCRLLDVGDSITFTPLNGGKGMEDVHRLLRTDS